MAKYLNDTGLSHLMTKVKEWAAATFAPLSHTHDYTKTRVKGNAESSYRTGDVNLTPANIGALPTEGGTLTGSLYIKDGAINRDGANPSSNINGENLVFLDKDGEWTGIIQNMQLMNGGMETMMRVMGDDASNQEVFNYFSVGVNKDGTLFYEVANNAKFRSDLGITPANIGALPLYGGTMTGTLTNDKYSFVAKYHGTNDEFDRDGAVPTADRWSTGFYINDKDGETTAFLRSVRRATTGRMDTILYAYNEPNGGGDPVSNSFIVGVERDGTSYYYVPDKPKFRTDMETLGAVTKNGYGGMMHPSGNDTAYMRTTQSGLIPYQSGGASAIGTSAWPFSSGYFNALTVGGVSVRNAGIINAGTLPLARGGTGASLSAAPSIIVDLASTSGASPFAASPKPGVTGILPQAHGGTGLGTAYANITSYDLGSTPIKTSEWTECRYPTSGTSAPARVKPGAGVYIVFLSFAFAANATGSRLITAGTTSDVTGYSDSNYLAARLQASSSGTTKSTTATVTEFGANDTLYVRAWQNSGATINCAVHVRLVRIA